MIENEFKSKLKDTFKVAIGGLIINSAFNFLFNFYMNYEPPIVRKGDVFYKSEKNSIQNGLSKLNIEVNNEEYILPLINYDYNGDSITDVSAHYAGTFKNGKLRRDKHASFVLIYKNGKIKYARADEDRNMTLGNRMSEKKLLKQLKISIERHWICKKNYKKI